MTKKLPYYPLYTGDWMKNTGLRAASPAARALWVDMLCLMHENVRRGYLQNAAGKPISQESLARMTGFSSDEVSGLLQELIDSGVLSRTEHGTYYSVEMVKAEHKRMACAKAGKRGGGNPHIQPADYDFAPPDEGIPISDTFKGQDKGQLNVGDKGEKNDISCQEKEEANASSGGQSFGARQKQLAGIFSAKFFEMESIPYIGKKGDFVQLATLMKKAADANWPITDQRWNQALRHYFQSPLGAHTLAHLCVEFSAFYKHPLDRFGKPVAIQQSEQAKVIPITVNQTPGLCNVCFGNLTVPYKDPETNLVKGRKPCPKCAVQQKTA